nr:adenine phosphoribosyltransferase [Actinomycetota bacterium]
MSPAAPDGSALRDIVLARLRDVPDFPEPGVTFKDFSPLLADGAALAMLVEDIAGRYAGRVEVVAGIEARGFILGAATAYRLGVGFVPVRKVGKLPAATHRVAYDLEYGSAVLEIHQDAFTTGARVLVMDDVLATGGTAAATCDLVERGGGVVVAVET